MSFARASSVLLASLVAGGLFGATTAEARSCRTGDSTILKRNGNGIISKKTVEDEGVVYTACSKTYGKRARLGSDTSALVDSDFKIKSSSVNSTSAKFVYCVTTESSFFRYTVTANLKTGKATTRSTPVTTTC